MRLAAQLRGGFYPAHPQAIAHAATFLRPPQQSSFALLDPCAGEAAAARQLGELLGCPQSMLYAIELDDNRAQCIRANLPGAQVLAPASFFGCQASLNAFSFIWLNPPFDDGYAGHRVEEQFLRTATEWLMPGGVMAFVCPEDVADEYTDTRQHFATYYDNCTIVPFPEKYRPFREIIVIGHKRKKPRADHRGSIPWDAAQAAEGFVYRIPPGIPPRMFRKVEPTESELQHLLAKSPLRTHLTTPPELPLPSPPLPLGIGHVALLLASGQLDGVVQPEGQPPHVVRGTSRKREYVSDVTETVNDDGSTTSKTTITQRIELVVRTVDLTGHIASYLDTDSQEQ